MEAFIKKYNLLTLENQQLCESFDWLDFETTLRVNRTSVDILYSHYCQNEKDSNLLQFQYQKLALILCGREDCTWRIRADTWRIMYDFLSRNIFFIMFTLFNRQKHELLTVAVSLHDIRVVEDDKRYKIVLTKCHLKRLLYGKLRPFFRQKSIVQLLFEASDDYEDLLATNEASAEWSCSRLLNFLFEKVRNNHWEIDYDESMDTTIPFYDLSIVLNAATVLPYIVHDTDLLNRVDKLWNLNTSHMDYVDRFVYCSSFAACVGLNNVLHQNKVRPISIILFGTFDALCYKMPNTINKTNACWPVSVC